MLSVSSKHCNVWRPLPCSSLIVCGVPSAANFPLPSFPPVSFPLCFAHLVCLHFRPSGLHRFIWTRAWASWSLPLEAQIRQKLACQQLGPAGCLRGLALATRDSLPPWGPATSRCTRACRRRPPRLIWWIKILRGFWWKSGFGSVLVLSAVCCCFCHTGNFPWNESWFLSCWNNNATVFVSFCLFSLIVCSKIINFNHSPSSVGSRQQLIMCLRF